MAVDIQKIEKPGIALGFFVGTSGVYRSSFDLGQPCRMFSGLALLYSIINLSYRLGTS